MTLTREDATATRSQGLASLALYSAEAAGGSSARGQGRRGRAVCPGGGEGTVGARRSSPRTRLEAVRVAGGLATTGIAMFTCSRRKARY